METQIIMTTKADVWAAGIILYSLVHHGSHPYGTVGGGRLSKINALKSRSEVELPDIKCEPSDVAADLNETLRASLRKDPAERATAASLLCMDFLSGPIGLSK